MISFPCFTDDPKLSSQTAEQPTEDKDGESSKEDKEGSEEDDLEERLTKIRNKLKADTSEKKVAISAYSYLDEDEKEVRKRK